MHKELCELGEKWLRRQGCRVTLRDPFKANVCTGECPDVIGWRDGHSVLIECKVSRSDFLADKRKKFRADPALGMGDARLYLAPRGVIQPAELPEGNELLGRNTRDYKMQSRMEMIYIDSDGQARKTGVGAIFDTPAEPWAAFRSAKRLEVDVAESEFLLDYYNRKGDLADTIGLRRRDFERITGQKAKTEKEYRYLDRKYWDAALRPNA